MTYVITQSCCNDASCVEVCPVDCIHPTPDEPDFGTAEMLYINPDDCIDCGSCVEACPVGAVHADFEVPDHLSDYVAINADFFTWVEDLPDPIKPAPAGPAASGQASPLRVAVVGAGPSGWFVAEALAKTRRADVEVTVLDRLATPFGLVRYGVAPDHLSTKGATDMFTSVAGHRKVTVRLNVEIGRDVTHEELLAHHHAVVYTTGAARGRSLGLPGEDLAGSLSAADFVGWYNGHPDHADGSERFGLETALDSQRAVIIGNGNVALDAARLLLAGPDALRSSDMAAHAVAAIDAAAVEEVVVVARRGAQHAAFTTPELKALADHPDIAVVVDPEELSDLPETFDDLPRDSATYALTQKTALLRRIAASPQEGARRLVLRFGVTPVELTGQDRVDGVRLERTGTAGEAELLSAGLVMRATGYRSRPVDGVPFDEGAGRFGHHGGRVIDPHTGEPVPATYTAGWAKRGPSGVIGTNRACAAETADRVLDDFVEERLVAPSGGADAFDALLAERDIAHVDLPAWKRLDQYERSAGKEAGRPRLKVVDRAEQVRIAVAG